MSKPFPWNIHEKFLEIKIAFRSNVESTPTQSLYLDAEIDFGHDNNVSTIDVKFFSSKNVANVTAIATHLTQLEIF